MQSQDVVHTSPNWEKNSLTRCSFVLWGSPPTNTCRLAHGAAARGERTLAAARSGSTRDTVSYGIVSGNNFRCQLATNRRKKRELYHRAVAQSNTEFIAGLCDCVGLWRCGRQIATQHIQAKIVHYRCIEHLSLAIHDGPLGLQTGHSLSRGEGDEAKPCKWSTHTHTSVVNSCVATCI